MSTPDSEFTPSQEDLLEVINTQTEVARMGLDLGGVMALVTRRALQLTGAAGAVVELAEGDQMVYRAAAGSAEHQLGLRLDRDGSLSGLSVQFGTPLICDDSESDPRVDRMACRTVGLRSMVVVPLKHRETVVGVLKVLSPAPNAFGERESKLLGLMSDLIASAMFHATRNLVSDLFHRATHDLLTGLPNRALFFDRARQRQAQAARLREQFAIVALDMDELKPINDRFGHKAGDAALEEVGHRLSAAARHSDTVARLGGDEFGVLLFHVADFAEVDQIVGRLREGLARPFHWGEEPLSLASSVGIAVYPSDGMEVEALVEFADSAMYRAKRTRKSPDVGVLRPVHQSPSEPGKG